MKKQIKHLRISPIEKGDDYYLCNKSPLKENKWTWKKEEVTCKNCLKKLSKHPVYMQRREFQIM